MEIELWISLAIGQCVPQLPLIYLYALHLDGITYVQEPQPKTHEQSAHSSDRSVLSS